MAKQSGPFGAGKRPARVRRAQDCGNSAHPPDCCPMVAAVRSVKRGNFRLARRYAVLSARLLAGKVRAA